MKPIAVLLGLLALSFTVPAMAQSQNLSEEEVAKKLRESIDKEIDRLTLLLDLEDWQIFYVDSTLTYNTEAMIAERKQLQASKVTNVDLYYLSIDKWNEKTDAQYEKVFTPQQWEKYWKAGGKKAKKEREKRAAKASKADADLKNQK